MHWAPKCLSAISIMLLVGCNTPHTNSPENPIVSTSLCADGYLQSVPEIHPRLAALSWQSRSKLSQTSDNLRGLPQTDNDLERRLNWSNAVQISSAGGGGNIDLKWGEDFQTVWDNFETLSSQLNIPDKTALLKSRLKSIDKPARPLRVLYLDRAGATAGPDTFVDAVIQAAGGINIIQNPGWQTLDTETLINLQADVILSSFMESDYAGVNDRTLRHAALSDKLQSMPHIDIPGRYWPCAGPGLIDAAEHLSAAMVAL